MRLARYLGAATLAMCAACETSATSTTAISTSGGIHATQLAFVTQPAAATVNVAIAPPVQVSPEDASGNTDVNYVNAITLSIATNPGTGVLSGTLTVAPVNGIATFTDLSINQAGSGYVLRAAAPNLSSTTSRSFTINP